MYCRKCGSLNDDNAYKCIQCGEVLQTAVPAQPQQNLPEVPSHLALAIVTTVLCCLPLGIVSIVYAAQVNSKLQAGDYNGALNCSKKASLFGWISFGIGLCGILGYALIMIIAFATGAAGHQAYSY
jgi:uncharacterized membrane protein YvbJ